jgi:hypothetical protein
VVVGGCGSHASQPVPASAADWGWRECAWFARAAVRSGLPARCAACFWTDLRRINCRSRHCAVTYPPGGGQLDDVTCFTGFGDPRNDGLAANPGCLKFATKTSASSGKQVVRRGRDLSAAPGQAFEGIVSAHTWRGQRLWESIRAGSAGPATPVGVSRGHTPAAAGVAGDGLGAMAGPGWLMNEELRQAIRTRADARARAGATCDVRRATQGTDL